MLGRIEREDLFILLITCVVMSLEDDALIVHI